jgi:hypothetical protein
MSVAPYVKAIAAFVSTAAAGLLAALLLGSPGDAEITQAEWIAIAATTITATVGVFLAPANRPTEETPPAPAG